MNDTTTTVTVEVSTQVAIPEAIYITGADGGYAVLVHPSVPVETIDMLRPEIADAVHDAVNAWPQSPNGWS